RIDARAHLTDSVGKIFDRACATENPDRVRLPERKPVRRRDLHDLGAVLAASLGIAAFHVDPSGKTDGEVQADGMAKAAAELDGFAALAVGFRRVALQLPDQ